MNDPRTVFPIGALMEVESFPVNDDRALRDEVNGYSTDWDSYSDEARAAMASLVSEALLRLAEDVESWLPDAAVAKSDCSFGFFVWWKNRHLDEEIINQRTRADRETAERMADLERMAGRPHD